MLFFPLKNNLDFFPASLISFCIFLFLLIISLSACICVPDYLFIYQVHPSSFSIDGMLGNMRFCDMSLGPDHRWGWLCDIRKPGVESLIKVLLTYVCSHLYCVMIFGHS